MQSRPHQSQVRLENPVNNVINHQPQGFLPSTVWTLRSKPSNTKPKFHKVWLEHTAGVRWIKHDTKHRKKNTEISNVFQHFLTVEDVNGNLVGNYSSPMGCQSRLHFPPAVFPRLHTRWSPLTTTISGFISSYIQSQACFFQRGCWLLLS